jgi:hypothetical protein
MADRVRKVRYCYITVPARAGSAVRPLSALKDAGVNLLAFSGFPAGAGRAQLDFVVENVAAVRRVAARNGWRVSAPKRAFLVQGRDEPGAMNGHLRKLAKARLSVTAAIGVSAGGSRYGMLLWVKPRDYLRAAKALGAR